MPAQTASVEDILDEVDAFFMKKGPVHSTLRKLAERLSRERIDYAVIGGMALALHGFVRPTEDRARLRRRFSGLYPLFFIHQVTLTDCSDNTGGCD